MQCPAVPQTQL